MESSILDTVQDVHLYCYMMVNTSAVLDFENLQHEIDVCEKITQSIHKKHPDLSAQNIIKLYDKSPRENPVLPPIFGCLLTFDVQSRLSMSSFDILVDGENIPCRISEANYQLYTFNSAVIEIRVDFPEKYWKNTDVIRKLNFGFNKFFDVPAETRTGTVAACIDKVALEVHDILGETLIDEKIKQVTTPFLDLKNVYSNVLSVLWSHVAVVAHFPPGTNLSKDHYQTTMLNCTSEGVTNLSESTTDYAFTECTNSLFCTAVKLEDGMTIEQYTKRRWLFCMSLHEYGWKHTWDLDQVLSAFLNHVTVYLSGKQKHIHLDDISAINSFIDYCWISTYNHKARRIPKFFPSTMYYYVEIQNYMIGAHKNWETEMYMDECLDKMHELEKIVGQVYEHVDARRSLLVTRLLILLGIFGFASFIITYYSSVSMARMIGEIDMSIILVFIVVVFSYISLRLTR